MANKYLEFSNEFMACPKEAPGVYAIFLQESAEDKPILMYIGSSKNIRKRVSHPNHWYNILLKKHSGIAILKYIYCENYLELEKSLITKYVPPLNKKVCGRR